MTGATMSPGVDERAVRAALDQIKDPCSCVAGAPAGLSEMGLVKQVRATGTLNGVTVEVLLIATEPTCPFATMFVGEAERRIEAIPGVVSVVVRFDAHADWSEMDASPSYRERLNAVRRRRGLDPELLSGHARHQAERKGAPSR